MNSDLLTKRIRKVALDLAELTKDIEHNPQRGAFFADLIKQRIFELYDLAAELQSEMTGETQINAPSSLKNTKQLFKETSNVADINTKESTPEIEAPKPPVAPSIEVETQAPTPPQNTPHLEPSSKDEPAIPSLEPDSQEPLEQQQESETRTPKPELTQPQAETLLFETDQSAESEPKQEETQKPQPKATWLPVILEDTLEKKLKIKDITQKSQNAPLPDLNKGISISQKHEFISGLFSGNSSEYRLAIEQIESAPSLEQALGWLENEVVDHNQWQKKERLVSEFLFLVQRRFL